MDYNFLIFEKPTDRPVFWMDETSGEMKAIVDKFFDYEKLSEKEVIILKEYMLQWCMAPLFSVPENILNKLAEANSKADLKLIYGLLLDIGNDPF